MFLKNTGSIHSFHRNLQLRAVSFIVYKWDIEMAGKNLMLSQILKKARLVEFFLTNCVGELVKDFYK